MGSSPNNPPSLPSALDVAELILQRSGPLGGLKLQKLVYYAQAWSLATNGRPLFRERVVAWKHGPAVSEVWQVHAGSTKVATVNGKPDALDPSAQAFVAEVLAYYGHLSGSDLRRMTHDEGPWKAARGNLPDDAQSANEITHEQMRSFYSKRPWGKAKPVTDLSAFSAERVRAARKDIEAGRFTTLDPFGDALQDPDS